MKTKKSKKGNFVCAVFLFCFVFLLSLPGTTEGAIVPDPSSASSPTELVKTRLYLAIMLGGFFVFGVLIYGGILYMTSAGNAAKMIEARNRISAAFLGILILLSSYLLLKTISPQFLLLEEPDLSSADLEERKQIPLPPSTEINSSIDVEIPLGRMIEGRIFETYVDEIPQPSTKKLPRMIRIDNNVSAIYELSSSLRQQSEDLKKATEKCSCTQSRPCCEDSNPGPGCTDNNCTSKPGCTCDPCKNVRGEIEDLKEKNLKVISLGTNVLQKNERGDVSRSIKTSLIQEIEKALWEIEDLKKEIKRLERAEKFLQECPWRKLNPYTRYLLQKENYEASGFITRDIKFWDGIGIFYLNRTQNDWGNIVLEEEYDYATFNCTISGTLEEKHPFTEWAPAENTWSGDMSIQEVEEKSDFMACSSEAPVGEYISRAKKNGYKIIERMEELIKLTKQMIGEVAGFTTSGKTDGLHVLVSQCSSQGPSPLVPGRSGCFSVCHETETSCIKRCQGQPCPDGPIEEKLKKINKLFFGTAPISSLQRNNEPEQEEGIIDMVYTPLPGTPDTLKTDLDPKKREQVGVITVLEKIVPVFLEEFKKNIRRPMTLCVAQSWEYGADRLLLSCSQARRGSSPESVISGGGVIRECCTPKDFEENNASSSPFGQCLEECYLEPNQETYRRCLDVCLTEKSKSLSMPYLPDCLHWLNFYCCHIK